MKKRTQRINLVAMILTVSVVLSTTMLTVFAGEKNPYSSKTTTSFTCRLPLGGDEGKTFKAEKEEATLSFSVMGEPDGSRKVCYVYQIAMDDKTETIADIQKFERKLNNTANEVSLKFSQTRGSRYKYIFSIKKVLDKDKNELKVGDEVDKWPNIKPQVKYPFVIKKGLKLSF